MKISENAKKAIYLGSLCSLAYLYLKLQYGNGAKKMEPKDYIVTKIQGEYAYLREVDKGEESELFIALYLLPEGTDIGTKLHYEFPEYTIVE